MALDAEHTHDSDAVESAEAIAVTEARHVLEFPSGNVVVVNGPSRVRIGRGGQSPGVYGAEVYDELGRPQGICALKTVERSTRSGARIGHELSIMLEVESRFLERGERPAIPRAHETLEDDDYAYLLMEYVPGKTLAQCIAEGLSLSEAVDITDQLLHILSVLQDEVPKGSNTLAARKRRPAIVHGDITPHNILVMNGRAVLLDFGTSFAVNEVDPDEHNPWGKPVWLAPEQCLGVKTDPRSDVFGAGAGLLEAISGGEYSRRRNKSAQLPILYAAVHGDLPIVVERLLQEHAEVPDAVKDVIRIAMAREPKNRYQTALEMQAALRRAMKATQTRPWVGAAALKHLLGFGS